MSDLGQPNRLIEETSPYLRQHAYNPVQWYPWGEEAFERARREDKPILLSIGYSACHWCHVMERESFENEEIARLMNELFVNVKVDREERPDLDALYMSAVQAMTGQGGWPLTVFLTPEGVPFFGGTYFPPEDRYGMPGFPRLLLSVARAYRERRQDVLTAGRELVAHLQRLHEVTPSPADLASDLLDTAFAHFVRRFDPEEGGFGSAPKFPPSLALDFLLRYFHRTGHEKAREMVELTLEKMARGGIYDHLGGGFHRYATDARWLVPHFEKMLYDNALLPRVYLRAYQLTGRPLYRRIVEETLDYVIREMTDPSGGFYSTQDADSEGQEGKFFVWTRREILDALGDADGEIVCRSFGVTDHGNFEGKNVLSIPRDIEIVARLEGLPVERVADIVERGRRLLFDLRRQRVAPSRDEKIIAAWNGLMLRTFAEAAAVLENDTYRQVAQRNAEFLLAHLCHGAELFHTSTAGRTKIPAFLDDYACVCDGLLALYEVDFDLGWLVNARSLAEAMIEKFWDAQVGGFFYTSDAHTDSIVRLKDFFDNATPSGNSVAADVLLRLSRLLGRDDFREKTRIILHLARENILRFPSGFGHLLGVLDSFLSPSREFVLAADPEAAEAQAMLRVIHRRFLPDKVIAVARPGDSQAADLIPLLKGRVPPAGATGCTVYLCENYICHAPVTRSDELERRLMAVEH
jgi:hypothetical protein